MQLADGRLIGWRELGDEQGFPIVALHGTPGSRRKFEPGHETAAHLGLRLISLDRWSYGMTSAHPKPSFPAFAADVRAVAEHLRLDRFAVLGVSGGGPYAAGVAASLAGRVSALALVSPVGLVGSTCAGRDMSAFHRLCFRGLPRVPGAISMPFAMLRLLLRWSPDLAVRLAAARAAPADRLLMTDRDFRRSLAEAFTTGLAGGVQGPVTDMALFAGIWNFNPASIVVPTRLWLGTQDRNVPPIPAHQLAQAIEGSELTLLPGEGHYWIANHLDEVLQWLAEST